MFDGPTPRHTKVFFHHPMHVEKRLCRFHPKGKCEKAVSITGLNINMLTFDDRN